MAPTRDQILARFDGDEEAMKAHYREMQKKSRKTYEGTGGFAALTPEQRSEISKKAAQARWGKNVPSDNQPTDAR